MEDLKKMSEYKFFMMRIVKKMGMVENGVFLFELEV